MGLMEQESTGMPGSLRRASLAETTEKGKAYRFNCTQIKQVEMKS